MIWLRRVWSWRLWFVTPRLTIDQIAAAPRASMEPAGGNVSAFVTHVHRWGACKRYGFYWYAICLSECGTKTAC